MEYFSTAYLFYVGLQILVVSWTHPFLQQRCFFWGGGGGGISLIFVSYIIYRPNVQAMGGV